MRILLISGEFPPDIGGVGDYSRHLAHALVDRGHHIAVLTGRYGLIQFWVASSEFRVVYKDSTDRSAQSTAGITKPATRNSQLATRNSQLATWSLRPIDIALRAFRPDLVHLQYQTGAYGMHPGVLLLPARLRMRGRMPVLVTAHDLRLPYLFPKADLLRNWLTGRLLEDAAAVIVTNGEDARRLNGQAPPSRELYSPRRRGKQRATTIPIGSNIQPVPPYSFDRAAYRAMLGAGTDTVLLVYFGLLSRTKGVVELLHALNTLPARFRLLIAGGAAPLPDDRRYAAEVERTIVQLDLGTRVVISGPLDEQAVSAQLLASDIAVLPFADGASYRRGSLLAVLAHGLPTITTQPAAQLDPPLQHGRHALLLPPADSVTLRGAIEQLAHDQQLRESLSNGARELAAYFGWPGIAARHENVYDQVLNIAGD